MDLTKRADVEKIEEREREREIKRGRGS